MSIEDEIEAAADDLEDDAWIEDLGADVSGPSEPEGDEEGEPDEDAVESDEDDQIQDDEDSDDDEAEDPDSDEDEGDEDEPEEEPRGSEQDLRSIVQHQAQQIEVLTRLVSQQQQQPQSGTVPGQQPQPQIDPRFLEAARILWRGGEQAPEGIKQFDPHVQREAARAVENIHQAVLEHHLDPLRAYQEKYARYVEDHVHQILDPLQKAVAESRKKDADAQALAEISRLGLKSGDEKQELGRILASLNPRWADGSLEEVRERLRTAAELLNSRRDRSKISKQKRRLDGQEKQARQRKRTRRRSGKPTRRPATVPDMGDDFDVVAFAEQIQDMDLSSFDLD